MLKNYLKIAIRNLKRSKGFSFINIAGLAIGITVAMLIGLWAWDEFSYDRHFRQYDRIGQIYLTYNHNGKFDTYNSMPIPMAAELRTQYSGDFKYVILSSWTMGHILATGEKKMIQQGNYAQPQITDMLSLEMIRGSRTALNDPSSLLISESLSKALFGDADPIGQAVKIDNNLFVKVTGVYRDFPYNTEFRDVAYFLPWDLYASGSSWVKEAEQEWDNNSFQIYVQLQPGADFRKVSEKIKSVKFDHTPGDSKSKEFIHPMSKWHLYRDFKDGINTGGRIQFVWLFCIVGVFVLLLACINFMNLSTARSEKRAKEVGIRKTVGSLRNQLIGQFLSESILISLFAFLLSLGLLMLSLHWFNEIADKKMVIPWSSPIFWSVAIGFVFITGILAGSYPAFYLSSFEPVKVLKGTFKAGRFSAIPRKVLVVIQFTVSVSLIIGTIIVYGQIQYAKDRPVGYSRAGLISVPLNSPDLNGHYNALRDALLKTGAVADMAQSSSPTTAVQSNLIGFDWTGKDPHLLALFGVIAISHDFGHTVGWEFLEGRDFSRAFPTDSMGFVLNASAAKFIGFKHSTGETIKFNDKNYHVLGVIKDMVMSSPFEPAKPTVFLLHYGWANYIDIKLSPTIAVRDGLAKIETVFRKFDPGSPFSYKFADQEYALKFSSEERIGKLSGVFAILAVLISCLGLFGLASFIAEQRTKEIGVRKVLGATIVNLWGLLSRDFLLLLMISFLIAIPAAYFFMSHWLMDYDYRYEISIWIFVVVILGASLITLLTVSFQAIRAALMNPVTSLRSE